jgi:hypothetical protein
MGIVKLPKMSNEEIKEVIRSENICRIAFIDDNFPYIAPFQYIYLKNQLYFHFTDYGKKKSILNSNKNVCVSIEQFQRDLSEFYFISIQGFLEPVNDGGLTEEVIQKILSKINTKFSKNFLSVHGLNNEDNQSENYAEKFPLIFRLKEIGKRVGLRSPR